MAKYIGYKYSEAATQYTRIYFYPKSVDHEAAAKELKYLSTKYENDSRYDKPTRLNNLLNEMNINVYDSYNQGCTFEYSLVATKFQRKYVLRKAVTMAQHVVQLGYQGTMCAYLTQTNGTIWETLNEIEESIKSITVLLDTVPASILNSTWPSIQIRQIKEIIEEIPEDSIDQTNGSFAKIAAHIYKKQAAVGHPIYKLQILVIPYSSRNIEDNTKLWYSCRPNVCQLIQREEKFNVLAIRVEGSGKEDSSNSSELQQYVDSIKPKILEEFDIR